MLFEPCETIDQKARILVVGVGGAGGNALNRMIVDNLTGVEFIALPPAPPTPTTSIRAFWSIVSHGSNNMVPPVMVSYSFELN
jgi:cell division protein FtsZ